MPIKTGFCASSVCISLLKHALKLKRHAVDLLLLHIAHSDGYFRDDVPCWRGSGLGQMRGCYLKSGGLHPLKGLYNNILDSISGVCDLLTLKHHPVLLFA